MENSKQDFSSLELHSSLDVDADNEVLASLAFQNKPGSLLEENMQTESLSKPVHSIPFLYPLQAVFSPIKQGVGNRPGQIKFFGPIFMLIWVFPMSLTAILMEFVFISPLTNTNPFSNHF